jgi:hypothetical protein
MKPEMRESHRPPKTVLVGVDFGDASARLLDASLAGSWKHPPFDPPLLNVAESSTGVVAREIVTPNGHTFTFRSFVFGNASSCVKLHS